MFYLLRLTFICIVSHHFVLCSTGTNTSVIEIKPGNEGAAKALCSLFSNEPHLLQSVGVIMSFDLWVIHQFAAEFALLEQKWKQQQQVRSGVVLHVWSSALCRRLCNGSGDPQTVNATQWM